MGGIEKADMLLSLYRTKFKSHKWYHQIAFHLFSLSSTSALIEYKEIGSKTALVNSLEKICQSLICVGANLIGESDDEIDKLSTKCHLTAEHIPSGILYDKHIH